jgi:hypothetical protein
MNVILNSAKISFETPNHHVIINGNEFDNDNKDHDTCFWMGLWDIYGQLRNSTYIADGVEYEDGSIHEAQFNLSVNIPAGYVIPKTNGETIQKFSIEINPVGNDTWVFRPTIILGFSDGTSWHYQAPYCRVNQGSRRVDLFIQYI